MGKQNNSVYLCLWASLANRCYHFVITWMLFRPLWCLQCCGNVSWVPTHPDSCAMYPGVVMQLWKHLVLSIKTWNLWEKGNNNHTYMSLDRVKEAQRRRGRSLSESRNRSSLSSWQARTHHGAVELSHLGGKHPRLSDRRLLGFLQLGHVLHRSRAHHRCHGCRLLPLSHRAWVQPSHWLKGCNTVPLWLFVFNLHVRDSFWLYCTFFLSPDPNDLKSMYAQNCSPDKSVSFSLISFW